MEQLKPATVLISEKVIINITEKEEKENELSKNLCGKYKEQLTADQKIIIFSIFDEKKKVISLVPVVSNEDGSLTNVDLLFDVSCK